jgi:hypothetical protein
VVEKIEGAPDAVRADVREILASERQQAQAEQAQLAQGIILSFIFHV